MEENLKQLKSVLRSLVVSSCVEMDMRALARDYQKMMGEYIPIYKFGYKDLSLFLRENCQDCFLFHGPIVNPTLTLIVPANLQHIDKFVQNQKRDKNVKFQMKRHSIPQSVAMPLPSTSNGAAWAKPNTPSNFTKSNPTTTPTVATQRPPPGLVLPPPPGLLPTPPRAPLPSPALAPTPPPNKQYTPVIQLTSPPTQARPQQQTPPAQYVPPKKPLPNNSKLTAPPTKPVARNAGDHEPRARAIRSRAHDRSMDFALQDTTKSLADMSIGRTKPNADDRLTKLNSRAAEHFEKPSTSAGSAGMTQTRALYLQICSRVTELLKEHSTGVFSSTLLQMYRVRFGEEMPYRRLGFLTFMDAAGVLPLKLHLPATGSDWVLLPPDAPVPPPPPPRARSPPPPPDDAGDALPGVVGDAGPYADAHARIAPASLRGVAAGARLAVCVGEVYSPARLWLIRRGPAHMDAMERLMDEMNEYFERGPGAASAAPPARVGRCCAALFLGHWHRAVVVVDFDETQVKVLYVDYGTVGLVHKSALRPLLRAWLSLEAQAVRALLQGARLAEGGGWLCASTGVLVSLVKSRELLATVTGVNHEHRVLEVVLADQLRGGATINDDLCVYAQAQAPTAASPMFYMAPPFEALESGAAPNYGEIVSLLQMGMTADYIEEISNGMDAAAAPPPAPAPPHPPPPAKTQPKPVESCVHVSVLDCEVYLKLCNIDELTASQHMLATLARAEADPAADPAHDPAGDPARDPARYPARDPALVAISAQDCRQFRTLLLTHVNTAHRYLVSVLRRARPGLVPTGLR